MTAILHDEKLAELLDEGATGSRSWGLELHRGTTVLDLEQMVERAERHAEQLRDEQEEKSGAK